MDKEELETKILNNKHRIQNYRNNIKVLQDENIAYQKELNKDSWFITATRNELELLDKGE